ncbi:hypothetical protein EJ08DRAFT_645630 [Tothia fuscella]|uniref:ABM domain-containing protein n=1 Tax=Tothia fuscella TaxID=1048955 RepID=A0A9P4U3I1_9PEZI|nr:hypothetical protein EJ08DRAFT_645630 [Tothia fuscella]
MAETEVVTVIAVLSPKPGKKQRVIELLTTLVNGVTAHEPKTLQYEMHTQIDSDDIVMIEKYVDVEARLIHRDQPHFMEMFKVIANEKLLSQDLELRVLKKIAGFANR